MYLITSVLHFPPVDQATEEGLLAIGGDLSHERLLLAYNNGIFPWSDPHEPILWWAPAERMVVDPHNYKVPKSLRNIINRNLFEVTINKDFGAVIVNCQKIARKDQEGTWISTDVVNAYNKLHKLGKAMSFEVWQDGKLVGGLYGVDLGHVFCGESMFSKVPNASKVAFVKLIEYLKQNNYKLLDCQVHNDHLERLGAFEISREIFMRILKDKS